MDSIELAKECGAVLTATSGHMYCEKGELIFACDNDIQQFAQALQPQWQPIESAPKDGTRIMLWEQYSDVPFVGWWVPSAWTVSHEHVDAVGGWEGAIVVDRIEQKFITHWMPLPQPPQVTK